MLHAQTITGEIDGTVLDSLGAVIPGATVTLIDTDTGETVRTVVSDSKGNYSVPLLQIGTYTVTASRDGFNISKAEGIQLHISDTISVNLTLSVRAANAEVTVTAEKGVATELESAAQTSVVTGTEMKELALNTRNFEQMIQLDPGVSFGGDSDQTYTGLVSPSGTSNNANLSIDGERATQNAYLLDGTDILAHGANNQVSLFPSIDSIQELRVIRDSYGAEYGGGGAAQIQIITKAGGSEFHGDMYVFVRNAIFNANTFFGKRATPPQARPIDDSYEGGLSIGGPVYIPHLFTKLRDNTFFFYSLQISRDTVGSVDNIANAPTPAQVAGNFAPYLVCTGYVGNTCTTTGTQITNVDPEAAAYVKDIFGTLPAPNQGPTAPQQLILNQTGEHNETQQLVRIDHSFNERLSMFFRYIHDPIYILAPDGYNRSNGYPGVSTTGLPTVGDGYMLHATLALTPATVLDAAFSFQPYSIGAQVLGLLASQNSPDIRPILPFTSTVARVPSLTINGGTALNATGPSSDSNRTYQGFMNVFHVFGQQKVSVGFNYEHFYENVNQGTANAGTFVFGGGGNPATGVTPAYNQSFANFLLGHYSSFTQSSIDPTAQSRGNLYEGYVEDDWKILPRLTLNLGVRYSLYKQPTDAGNHLGSFDPKFYNPGTAPTIQANTGGAATLNTGGLICATAPCVGTSPNPNYNAALYDGVIQGSIDSPYGATVTNQPKYNFAPRFGFALDVYGDGKTSLRGGFGVFYNQVPLGVIQSAVYNNPYYSKSVSFTGGTFSDPAAGSAGTTALIPPNVNGISTNWKTPYTEAYSLGIQQQMPIGVLLDIRYVGNNSRHLVGQVDINQPYPDEYITAGIYGTTAISAANTQILNQIRPYKGFGPILSEVPEFTSNYNALQVAANRRFSKRSRISVAYTWSRGMTDSLADTGYAPENSYNIQAEYGPSQIDRRQVLTAHFVYELPFFEEQHGWKGHLLGGYEFSGIVTAAAGLPLTVITNVAYDPAGQGVLAGGAIEIVRPNQLGDPNADAPHGGSSHLDNPLTWFNVAEHYQNATLLPGTERNGSVRGPGYVVYNLDLFKNISINQKTHLQLRAEAFNAFNHTSFTTVNLQLSNISAGQVIGARDPRKMQFGIKYIF